MTIRTQDILPMIEDWLRTPVHTHFGSSYGADLASLLLRQLSAPIADEFLAKLKRDVPILAELSADQLSLVSENIGFEQKQIYLQLGQVAINLNDIADQQSAAGETFDVEAG